MKFSELIYKVSGAFSKTKQSREVTNYSSGRKKQGGGYALPSGYKKSHSGMFKKIYMEKNTSFNLYTSWFMIHVLGNSLNISMPLQSKVLQA